MKSVHNVGENFGWKKGLEISSNRLYAPLLLKKIWLKNHAYNIPDFTVILPQRKIKHVNFFLRGQYMSRAFLSSNEDQRYLTKIPIYHLLVDIGILALDILPPDPSTLLFIQLYARSFNAKISYKNYAEFSSTNN